jgi:hypothetical protein
VSPSVWVQSDWARHALNFNASGDFTRYDRYSTEDTNDGRVSAEGRYDLSGDANVYGGWRWLRDHEDRESAEGRNGLEPTVYFINRGYAGAFKQIERVSLRLAGSAYRYNYRDVPFLASSGQILTINNDDRDRNRYTGGLRVGYEVTPRIEAFVQGGLDNRIYDNPVDQIVATDPSFRRDSTGWRGYAGVRATCPDAQGRGVWRVDEPELQGAGTRGRQHPGVGANVVWRATPASNVSVFADRTIEETTIWRQTPPCDHVRFGLRQLVPQRDLRRPPLRPLVPVGARLLVRNDFEGSRATTTATAPAAARGLPCRALDVR